MSEEVTYDISHIPFRILRPLQKTLANMCKAALAVQSDEWMKEHMDLSARVVFSDELSKREMNNPTREVLLGNVVAWWNLLTEVQTTVEQGKIADDIQGFRSQLGWLEKLANDVRKAHEKA